MDREEFVKHCGELLRMAKPHLVECRIINDASELPVAGTFMHRGEDSKYFKDCKHIYESVLITADNGYHYAVPIEGNSLGAIAEEIFVCMVGK